jgi:hypothetical protein
MNSVLFLSNVSPKAMWAAEDVAFKYYATSLAGDVAEKEVKTP